MIFIFLKLLEYSGPVQTNKKKKLRRIISINEKIILKNWLRLKGDHLPTSNDISYLACHTKLSKAQIKKWLINNKHRSLKNKKIINSSKRKR